MVSFFGFSCSSKYASSFSGFPLLPLYSTNEKIQREGFLSSTSDGGFLLSGTHAELSNSEEYLVVLKLSSSGALERATRIGESANNKGFIASESTDGGIIALMER